MTEKKKRSLGRPRSSEQDKATNIIILEAATALFLSKGFQNVSMDDVAKQCNLTKATVYYYFQSKAELFTESIVQMMSRIREYMKIILLEDAPLRTRLHRVVGAHLKATVEIDLDGFVRETKDSLTKEQHKQIQEAEDKMFEAIEKAFSDEMEGGKIPEVNPTFAAHSFIALLRVGNYRKQDQTPLFSSIEETTDKIIDFFWNGLFPR